MTNLEWIQKGNTGCTFATLFAKNPEAVGWKLISPREYRLRSFPEDTLIISVVFNPAFFNKEFVREWALQNGFYEEETSKDTIGLRIKCKQGVSWVQYFGPDSHVKTRQSPYPMLVYCNKLNKRFYFQVGFKGILHLAHAWYSKISDRVYDLLWERSYKQTSKILGHKPDIKSAAKTTWLK